MSLQGRRAEGVAVLAQRPEFRARPTRGYRDDSREVPMVDLAKWESELVTSPGDSSVWWGEGANDYVLRNDTKLDVIAFPIRTPLKSDADAIALFEAMPFTVATMGPAGDHNPKSKWFPGHIKLGWGVAFRGAGHEIMMSRRWIARGPWRAIERPGDLTILQVHPFDGARAEVDRLIVAASAALYWRTGGEITRHAEPVKGLYTATSRTFEIVVPPNAAVSTEQMNSARALRDQKKAVDPIERVAFVFIDETDARRQLDDLWVRDLEVWYVDGSGRHRLDDTYKPPPRTQPAWIEKRSQT